MNTPSPRQIGEGWGEGISLVHPFASFASRSHLGERLDDHTQPNQNLSTPRLTDIGRETRSNSIKLQLELRYCEKRAYDLFLQNLIKGTSHLSLGQEAIAAAFRRGDAAR